MNLLALVYNLLSFCKLFNVSIAFWIDPDLWICFPFYFSCDPSPCCFAAFFPTKLLFLYISENDMLPVLKSITNLLQLIFHTIQILVIYLLQFNLLLFKCILVVACLHIHFRWCMFWIVRLVVKHRQCPVVQVFSVVWGSWQRLTICNEWLHAWLACLVSCLAWFCVTIFWCALVFYNCSSVFHVPHLQHWRVGLQ